MSYSPTWAGGIAGNWSSHLYCFATDDHDGTQVYARFFAPDVGVEEDPATGSACASLAASLAHRSAERDGTYHLRITQGVAMGRPSTLEGTAHKKDGQITEVAVGGRATIVGNGTMTLPPDPAR